MFVPLIQTWELSSPDTQIFAELGVQAAHTSQPSPAIHIKQTNRKKRTPFGMLGAHVTSCVWDFSETMTVLLSGFERVLTILTEERRT